MATVLLGNLRKISPNGFEAVAPTSFDIADGEFVVLIDPSDRGKDAQTDRVMKLTGSPDGGDLGNGILGSMSRGGTPLSDHDCVWCAVSRK